MASTQTSISKSSSEQPEDKSFFGVIVHSFFIIPFFIALFCLLLFTAMNLLTHEKRTVYDYLEDVKTGGASKRWQGAFQLSNYFANPEHVRWQGAFELSKMMHQDNQALADPKFINALIKAFDDSKHDDPRVRQYLALAMGRTGRQEFAQPLINTLSSEKEENVPAILFALGSLKNKASIETIKNFTDFPNARIRSMAIAALGTIADPDTITTLRKGLTDPEPNVQWGAALSLARMGNDEGKNILLNLLSRDYYSKFSEIDQTEASDMLLTAISAAKILNNNELNQQLSVIAKNDPSLKVRSAADRK